MRIRIPLRFYLDHQERDLYTPVNYSKAKSYVVIDSDDEALPELISDAEHYAAIGTGEGGYFQMGYGGLVLSARATLKAIERGTK
jgi:hypothetical protein